MASSSSPSFLEQMVQLDRAAQVAPRVTRAATKEVPLTDEAAELPPHIIAATDAQKLNLQTPIFRCPAWADLPAQAYHLQCTRSGTALPSLALHRYPFYLFGKSPSCDYTLEHPSVSSVHAALVFHKDQACFVLVDLSTNGSRLNERRVEKHKPVPVPVGSILKFGYSSRQYELCAGAARSAKRERSDGDSTDQQQVNGGARVSPVRARSSDPAPAPIADSTTVATPHASVASTAPVVAPAAAAVSSPLPIADTTVTTAAAAAAAAVEEAPAPRQLHLFQLVIKHKDVSNPVSRGRNKGEVITRSAADAVEIAKFIVNQHKEKKQGTAAVGGKGSSSGFVAWSVEEFIEAVLAYCEMSNAKKKGDLGIVQEGTFSEAFDKAAFALRRLEVTAPVETPLGIHLIFRCD